MVLHGLLRDEAARPGPLRALGLVREDLPVEFARDEYRSGGGGGGGGGLACVTFSLEGKLACHASRVSRPRMSPQERLP